MDLGLVNDIDFRFENYKAARLQRYFWVNATTGLHILFDFRFENYKAARLQRCFWVNATTGLHILLISVLKITKQRVCNAVFG